MDAIRLRRYFVQRLSSLSLALFALFVSSAPAEAQTVYLGNAPAPPELPLTDPNGVVMPSGFLSVSVPQLTVGGLSQTLSNFTVGLRAPGSPSSCGSCFETYRHSGFYSASPLVSSFGGGLDFDTSTSAATATFTFGNVTERFKAVVTSTTIEPGDSISQSGGLMSALGR